MTLFERIVSREIPADIVYEDDLVLAFRDIHPVAPTHVLIIPKRALPGVSQASAADEALLGRLLMVASRLGAQLGLSEDGFRLVINDGTDGGQTIPHLHVHLLGGRLMSWPPG